MLNKLFPKNISKIIFLILFISSCSHTNYLNNNLNSKKSDSIPDFYINPKQNDSQNLYAVGSGYNLDRAIKVALNNLASKLMTNISSQSKSISKSHNDHFSSQYSQKITENVEKITFNNYKISNSANFNKEFYAEIKIDRENFLAQNITKLNNLNRRFHNLSKNLNKKHIIDQYRNLNKIQDNLYKAQSLNYVLGGIGYDRKKINKNFDNYQIYQNDFDNLTSKINIKIDQKSNSKISTIIKKYISDQKIKITKNNSKNNIILRIDKKLLMKDKIYDSFFVKLSINISLISKNKILSNNLLELSGNSVISGKEAENAAINKLHDLIKNDDIQKIIGLRK
jgi:hypothetical protein